MAIDVAAMYAERQQLQTGADAGALAIAQDCGRGACGATARDGTGVRDLESQQCLVHRNGDRAERYSGHRAQLGDQAASVRSGPRDRHHRIAASATADWGSPTGGTAELPLAISWCEWQAQTGGGLPSGTTERVISFPEKVRHRLHRPVRHAGSRRVRLARHRRRHLPDHELHRRSRGFLDRATRRPRMQPGRLRGLAGQDGDAAGLR